MSSEATAGEGAEALDDRVLALLETHLSGDVRRRATVERADRGAGTVALSFGCGCSGGLHPSEEAVVRTTLVERLPSVDTVHFESGCGCGSKAPRGNTPSDDGPAAPF